MAAAWSGDNKQGNNKLPVIAGALFILLLLLVWLGPGENSGIGQLLSAAAPDSSGYVADTTPVAANEEKKYAEFPDRNADDSTIAETANTALPASDSASQTPVDEAPAEAAAPITESNGTILSYRIKKGDTFFKIAAMFGNKPAELQELNNMEDMNLQADKNIRVKIKAMHSVGQGEGINAISEKYGVSSRSIKIANGLSSDALPSGSSLIIPLK